MLEFAKPEDLGLDAGRLARAEQIVIDGIEKGEYTAGVYLVARHGRIAAQGAFGRHGGEDAPEAKMDSIFDMASMTKPVATATSLMMLVERGMLHLNQPVTDFFPERKLPHLSNVTIKQLLTHTSGLPAWCDLFSKVGTRESAIEQLFQISLEAVPGTRYAYSCMGYITLGLVIEQITGIPLERFAAENVFNPLGMKDSGYNPSLDLCDRIVPTSNSRGRDYCLRGEVHDENAHAMGGNSGNAGLFSTAPDIAIYSQMMLNGGEYGGVRLLSPLSVKRMISNQIDPSIGGQGLGYFTRPNEMTPAADLFSAWAAGHTGFTGTSFLLDPEYDIFVILLTNRVYRKREAPDFLRRRRLFHNAVAASIVG
mgnify:CR=1 FL=1